MDTTKMTKEEALINAGFRKRTNYENADVYKIFSILYGLVVFIGGVSFSISHAIVPKSDAEIIKHLTEIYFTYLYWVSIIWIIFCIIDIVRHRRKVQIPKGTLNRLNSNQISCYSDTARIRQKKLILTSPEITPEPMIAPSIKIAVLDDPAKDQLNDANDFRVETSSDQVFIEHDETISLCDDRIESNSLDNSENQSLVAKPLIDTTRDILTRRRALDVTGKHDLQAYVRHRRSSIVQHVIGYNYDDNSIVGGLYTRVGIGIFCLGTVIHSSLSILSNLENSACIRWTAVIDDFSRLLFTFIQFFFVFKHSNLIIRAHESVARLAVIHIVVTNLCVWFRMVVIETISEIEKVDGHEATLIQTSNVSNHIDHGSHDAIKLIYRLLLIRSDCSHLAASGLKANYFIREGYLRLKPLLYPCTIEFSLMCLTLFFLIWENVGKTFPHKMSDKESTKNVFMVNCHASVKGLFTGMICFSCTLVATLLYAIFRNKIGDSLHTTSSSSPVIHHKHSNVIPTRAETILHQPHEMSSIITDSMAAVYQPLTPISNTLKKIDYSIVILEIVNLCLLTLSLCATIWALIKIRKLNYRRTTTRFDDVLIIVSLTGIYLYSIFSAFAIISNLSSSTWVAYVKLAIIILEFVEGTIHALFILLALRKRLRQTSKHKYPAREIITLLIMLDLSLWFEKTTTSTKHEANPFQLAFYHVIPWSIITAIATPLQIFFRFHASVCLSHVWANMYHLPPYEPIALRDF
ncbi:unnamed protein product [Rotaria magnacalcarata]|uniref:Uncharacterized protein n=4 Tax=Rotaria magnacalcarata TaxID=392030 RepID=A0A816TQ13_9BILA|nr:unnamed protein product [Rotaria magnacalcarata]CAF2102308.1 unnamed protein product [Rotaria magnacalcarata]